MSAMTDRHTDPERKPLMRSLGEFVGHIVKGIRTDPEKPEANAERTVIRETTEEEQQGNVILRRTTIEEVEVRRGDSESPPPADGANPPRA